MEWRSENGREYAAYCISRFCARLSDPVTISTQKRRRRENEGTGRRQTKSRSKNRQTKENVQTGEDGSEREKTKKIKKEKPILQVRAQTRVAAPM